MEDICFKFRNPEIYKKIQNKIELKKSTVDALFKEFIKHIESFLQELDIEYEIKYRLKSVASIYRKMKTKGVSFDEIYDVFAIRIIYDPKDYKREKSLAFTIYSIITDLYRPHPGRLRDWISNPKPNGYEALHTTVMGPGGKWLEVQIRSKRMDEIAEKGYAAHWKYKENKQGEEGEIDKWIARIRETLELQLKSNEDFLSTFEVDIFNLEVYVFTPKGEIKILPYGSTTLDFAYEIHSEIGDHSIGAKVNYKLVPLSYKLQSGDQVEIITSEQQKPQREWLDFVVTLRAKTKIKEAFKKERKENIEKGRSIFHKIKEKYRTLSTNKVLEFYNLKNKEELFCKIGSKEIKIEEDIKKIIESKRKSKYIRFWGFKLRKVLPASSKTTDKKKYIVSEADLDSFEIAKCCSPIPGDKIIGYKRDDGIIEIHKTDCPNIVNKGASEGENLVEIQWSSYRKLAFLARIRIKGLDRIGILQDITSIISNKRKINMRTVKIDTTGGFFDGYLDLYVSHKTHLDEIIAELKKIDGMKTVRREDIE